MASFIEKGRQNFAEVDDLDENLFDNIKKLRKIGKEVEDATKPEREAASRAIKKTGEKIIKTGQEIREKGKRAETIANRAINIEKIRANKSDTDTTSTKKKPKKTVVKVNKNTPKDVKVNWKSTVPPKSKTPSTSSSGQKLLPGSKKPVSFARSAAPVKPVTKPSRIQGQLPLGGEFAKDTVKKPRGTSGGRKRGSRNTIKTSPDQTTIPVKKPVTKELVKKPVTPKPVEKPVTPVKPVTPKPPTNKVSTVNPKLGSGKVRQSVKGPGSSTGQVTKGNLKFSGDTNYKSLLKKIDPPPTKPPVDPWFTKPTTSAKSFEKLPLNPGKAGYHPGFKKSTVPVKPPVQKPIPADTGSLKDVSKVKKSFSNFRKNLDDLKKDRIFKVSAKDSIDPIPRWQQAANQQGADPSIGRRVHYISQKEVNKLQDLTTSGKKQSKKIIKDLNKINTTKNKVITPEVVTNTPFDKKGLTPGKTSGGKDITIGGSKNNPLSTKSSTQTLKSMKPSDLVRKVSNAQSKLNKMNKIRSTTRKFSRLRGLGRVLAPVGAGLEGMDEFSRKKAQGKGNLEAGLAGLTRAGGGLLGSTLAATTTAAATKNPWATAAAGTAGWMGGADAATAAFDYGSKIVKGKKSFKDFNKDIKKTQVGKWWKSAGN